MRQEALGPKSSAPGFIAPSMSDDRSFSCGGAGSRGHPEASVRSAGRPGLLSIIRGAAHGDQGEMVPPLVQLLDPLGQRDWCGAESRGCGGLSSVGELGFKRSHYISLPHPARFPSVRMSLLLFSLSNCKRADLCSMYADVHSYFLIKSQILLSWWGS